jgi:hypothetical protein
LLRLCRIAGVDAAAAIDVVLSPNAVIVLLGRAQGRPVVVHLATDARSLRVLRRHRNGLAAAARSVPAALAPLVPAEVGLKRTGRTVALLQQRLPGRPGQVDALDEDAFRRAVERAMEPLLAIHHAARAQVAGPDAGFLQEKIHPLPGLLPQPFAAALRPAVQLIGDWRERARLPAVPVHGDYWLPNVLFGRHGEVAGLIDWEWYRDDGLPLFDAFNLLFMSLAMRRQVHCAALLPQVWAPETREPWVAAMLSRLSAQTGVGQYDQVRIAAVLWLSLIRRSHIETGPCSASWLDQAVTEPADSLQRHVLNHAAA